MSDFEIVLYQKQDGTQPVSEFIDSLNVKMQAKVLRSIGLLKQNGYELREPYTKTIQDGILELRIQQGNDIARILYFFVVEFFSSIKFNKVDFPLPYFPLIDIVNPPSL